MSESPTRADRPLATQAAAPPIVPPRRPVVGTAIADDELSERLRRDLQALRDRLDSASP